MISGVYTASNKCPAQNGLTIQDHELRVIYETGIR